MDFKAGDIIRMKEECRGIVHTWVEKGEICKLHWGARDGSLINTLWAWGEKDECYCQEKWELVKREKVKKPIGRPKKIRQPLYVVDDTVTTISFTSRKELNDWMKKYPYSSKDLTVWEIKNTYKVQSSTKFILKKV